MKRAILSTPVVLSLLVLGAHFMRYGNNAGVIASLALIGLLFVRRAWAARVVQAALVLGALEWVLTLARLSQARAAMGESATRMTVILCCVAAVTFASALLFQAKPLKQMYRLP